jgi:hypothetical protein
MVLRLIYFSVDLAYFGKFGGVPINDRNGAGIRYQDMVWSKSHHLAVLSVHICMDQMDVSGQDPATTDEICNSSRKGARDMVQSRIGADRQVDDCESDDEPEDRYISPLDNDTAEDVHR